MTTATWATRLRHDSDAVFREWGSEFATKLAAVGLVQTADTGQINWVTVVRAGINSNAGYEIWRFNDAQQGTAPIFIRFDYGTNTATNTPRLMMTVGTGSNGSGTITGTALTTSRNVYANSNSATVDTTYTSYMCCVDGFFGFAYKTGWIGACQAFILRTPDNTGVADATGAMVCWQSGSSLLTTQALRFAATAAAYTARTTITEAQLGFIPQLMSSSVLGSGDIQVAVGWTITPASIPLVGVCGVLDAEVSLGTTFSSTLVGSTARTYVGLVAGMPFSAIGNGPKMAMLWE